MAARLVTLGAATALLGLTLGPLAAVLARAGGAGAIEAADLHALRFTLWQAFLSACFSCVLAIPLARALARQTFFGRPLVVALLGAPFILPVIVAVLGLIAVFGRNGWVNAIGSGLGLPEMRIYGLHGLVLAHVFFNLPLATRMLLQAWLAIPSERFRLAASLGLSRRAVFVTLEWPILRQVLPGAFAIIFVICLTSFAVALTLGGGPRATTIEVAIYQAMRFDFDLGRAAVLATLQLIMGCTAGFMALRLAPKLGLGTGLDRSLPRWDRGGRRALDAGVILAACLFLLLPLGSVVVRGAAGVLALGSDTWHAAGVSIALAVVSSGLCLCWALALSTRAGELASLAAIAISPLVLGTGLFLLLRPVINPFDMALPVTALVNALMALPFALRILRPEAEAARRDFARLRASLGLTPLAWLRLVLIPRLKRPLGFSAGLAAALAMGDLGVITLFADPDRATLPLQVYRLMGAYRMQEAASAALLLLGLSLMLFWGFDRGGRVGA